MSSEKERLERIKVPELEKILGEALPVLDDGFVRLVDYMGCDDSIVQAARVSYGKGTKTTRDDRGLIRYLMRHRHTTPFEMCEVKLHVRVPMDIWRQWIRHRTANVNEYSTRYSIAIDTARATEPDAWRLQSDINRQGSEGGLDPAIGKKLSARETETQVMMREVYKERLEHGVAREQARKDLPLATYTEAYWKIDLHNLLHFLALRMDHKAQLEIREYARTIGEEIVSKWVPMAWGAFMDYRFGSVALSSEEIEAISLINAGKAKEALSLLQEAGFTKEDESGVKPTLEGRELAAKLERLGIEVPWENK